MNTTTSFCPKDINFFDIWVNHAMNRCFFDTISSSVVAAYICLFGAAQLIIYHKHATQIETRRLRKSFFFTFQLFLMIIMPAISISRLILRWKVYESHEIYGYMVRDCSYFQT